MASDLTDLSFVVMNLIGRHGAGPHDLVQMARRGQRLYWAGAESKIYAEPKRLATLGYLSSRKTPGKTRERTHYTLTDKGCVRYRSGWRCRRAFPASRASRRSGSRPATSPTTRASCSRASRRSARRSSS